MSKHRDYTKYSGRSQREEEKLIKEAEAKVNDAEIRMAEEVAVEAPPKPKAGVVTDCLKLNVREKPDKDSGIVCEITASTELVIYENESTEEFYKICTYSGIEGYCMKKFITILN